MELVLVDDHDRLGLDGLAMSVVLAVCAVLARRSRAGLVQVHRVRFGPVLLLVALKVTGQEVGCGNAALFSRVGSEVGGE